VNAGENLIDEWEAAQCAADDVAYVEWERLWDSYRERS
jgi:hypothetical protein